MDFMGFIFLIWILHIDFFNQATNTYKFILRLQILKTAGGYLSFLFAVREQLR